MWIKCRNIIEKMGYEVGRESVLQYYYDNIQTLIFLEILDLFLGFFVHSEWLNKSNWHSSGLLLTHFSNNRSKHPEFWLSFECFNTLCLCVLCYYRYFGGKSTGGLFSLQSGVFITFIGWLTVLFGDWELYILL